MNELLTVSEVAGILRVDRKTIARWIRIGTLEAVDLAKSDSNYHKYRIRRGDIRKLIEGGKSETNAIANQTND